MAFLMHILNRIPYFKEPTLDKSFKDVDDITGFNCNYEYIQIIDNIPLKQMWASPLMEVQQYDAVMHSRIYMLK